MIRTLVERLPLAPAPAPRPSWRARPPRRARERLSDRGAGRLHLRLHGGQRSVAGIPLALLLLPRRPRFAADLRQVRPGQHGALPAPGHRARTPRSSPPRSSTTGGGTAPRPGRGRDPLLSRRHLRRLRPAAGGRVRAAARPSSGLRPRLRRHRSENLAAFADRTARRRSARSDEIPCPRPAGPADDAPARSRPAGARDGHPQRHAGFVLGWRTLRRRRGRPRQAERLSRRGRRSSISAANRPGPATSRSRPRRSRPASCR